MLLLICCRCFFQELESYIGNEEFVIMLTDLRCPYDDHLLKQKQPQKYKNLSTNGTLTRTLEEVHEYSVHGLYQLHVLRMCANIYKCKKHFIKMLKDVGMVVPKTKETRL